MHTNVYATPSALKDEMRVLAAAVQDMDGVTLDNDTEESLANGDFDPVSATKDCHIFHSLIKRTSYAPTD